MHNQRMDLILESKVESADLAESLVNKFSELQYTERQHEEIKLAVREAIANAVLHGNQFDPGKRIYLTAVLQAHGIIITIRDEGDGCEIDLVPDPLAEDNLLRESGRGMLLIRTCMDEALWQKAASGGMELMMTKYFSKTSGNT